MHAYEGIRRELILLLESGNAHAGFDHIFRGFPVEARGKRPKGLPFSAWELLEHMRITQNDILQFIRDPSYESPQWPKGYWPDKESPPDAKSWETSLAAFRRDRQELIDLVKDPSQNLLDTIPHGTGQTLMREALVIADHTAYHLGQTVEIRTLLGIWNK